MATQEPIEATVVPLTPDQLDRMKVALKSMASEVLREELPSVLETLYERIGFSEEVAGLTRLLAARSGDSKEGVLGKALTLYGLALDAHEKGNRLAILNSDDEILQDIYGHEHTELIPAALAR